MHLVAQHSLEAGISEQKHVIASYFTTRTVNVVLAVLAVTRVFKSKTLHRAGRSVYNYFFVQGMTGHDILHPPNELEFVIVQLLDMADSSRAESVMGVVLQQESTHHF